MYQFLYLRGSALIPQRLSPGAAALVSVAHSIQRSEIPTLGVGVDEKGHIVLHLGKAYFEAKDDHARTMMLEHEACHVALGHSRRARALEKQRSPEPWNGAAWNCATDAAIHHHCLDPVALEAATGIQPVTFKQLDIPPCPPEVAYPLLLKQAEQHGGCGREVNFEDLPAWAQAEVAQAVAEAAGKMAGSERRMRPALGPVASEPPSWARILLAHLERRRGRRIRTRSWTRQHRTCPLLPGMARRADMGALIMVDCSGSISEPLLTEVSALLASARWQCEVILWAVDHTPRLPARTAIAMLRDGQAPSGGTSPAAAAKLRHPGERCIWITDGYVDAWPPMSADDVVLTCGDMPPEGVTGIKVEMG